MLAYRFLRDIPSSARNVASCPQRQELEAVRKLMADHYNAAETPLTCGYPQAAGRAASARRTLTASACIYLAE
jgi:hypothetical protein